MQKSSAPTAYILFTLLFVLIAVASFAAFTEAEEMCVQAEYCLRPASDPSNGEMIWEVISRQFLTLLPI
ncbi:MAG TPA: hypothetical protein VGN63_23560 [Flavisolibacter sp.]|jgi:hypothetical protein|nr:hypothetical protein [Flavisolibacter sp.]